VRFLSFVSSGFSAVTLGLAGIWLLLAFWTGRENANLSAACEA